MPDVFGIGGHGGGHGIGGLRLGRKRGAHLTEQGEEYGCGLFAGLHAGLMIGVDVDETGVEADGAFVESDQGAEVKGVDAWNRQGDRLAAIVIKGGARAAEKPLKVIARSDSGIDFRLRSEGGFPDLDKGGEEIVHAIAQLLHIGVLVG